MPNDPFIPPAPSAAPPIGLSVQTASTAGTPFIVDPTLPTFAQNVRLRTLDGNGELKLPRATFGQVPINPGDMLMIFINIARISTGDPAPAIGPGPGLLMPPEGGMQ